MSLFLLYDDVFLYIANDFLFFEIQKVKKIIALLF